MKLPPDMLERARLAVLNEMGWEDDRANTDEYAGKLLWELASDVAQAAINGAFPNDRARGPMPRGVCPICEREYALRQGVIRTHNRQDGVGIAIRCPGSGSLPAGPGGGVS
jgi:hypothetical protein